MIQTGMTGWSSQNLLLTVLVLSMFFVLILAVYIKFQVRIIYEGTRYKHYRKGVLMRESNKGGMVVLIPFLDKLEIIPSSNTTMDDTADYFNYKEFE